MILSTAKEYYLIQDTPESTHRYIVGIPKQAKSLALYPHFKNWRLTYQETKEMQKQGISVKHW